MCAKLTALETSPAFPSSQPAEGRHDSAEPYSSKTRLLSTNFRSCLKSARTYQQTSRGTDHTFSSQRCSRFPVRGGGWDPPCFVQRHVRKRHDFTLKMKNTHAEWNAVMSQTASPKVTSALSFPTFSAITLEGKPRSTLVKTIYICMISSPRSYKQACNVGLWSWDSLMPSCTPTTITVTTWTTQENLRIAWRGEFAS